MTLQYGEKETLMASSTPTLPKALTDLPLTYLRASWIFRGKGWLEVKPLCR